MTIDQALGILKPNPKTLDGLKKAFTGFCFQYHPDRNPNGLELMKLGNLARETLLKNPEIWTNEGYKQETDQPIAEEIDAIYNEIKHYPDLEITLAGCWLWVSGQTYPVKEHLKKMGFTWCSKKKMWSWKPEGQKRRWTKEAWEIDEIYAKYGRTDFRTEPRQGVRA